MKCMAVLTTLWIALAPAARGDEPASGKLLARPEQFETLVNPNCSHCVDEAKRRAADLRDSDRVLAWIRGNYQGGGIPYRFFLVPYRVISDTYGVFVYDPDAGYVRGYEPSLEFRFYGWRNGILVMQHADGTLFSALSGRAFDGPRKGETLKPVATLETDWGYWSAAYPGSVAYHMFEKYQPIDLPSQENADSVSTRGPADERLSADAMVLGLAVGDRARAYPQSLFGDESTLIRDRLGETELYVLWYAPTRTAAAYMTSIDESGGDRATLQVDASVPAAPFVDTETGSRWGIEGRAVDGPAKGKTLTWLPGVQCRWFAWAAEYPSTDLYELIARSRPADAPGAAAPAPPRRAVIASCDQVSEDQAHGWAEAGVSTIAIVLDESSAGEPVREAAAHATAAGIDVYAWIEIARNPTLADAHPTWMASLGLHDDWRTRFPDFPISGAGEVAKAWPWVPIAYQDAFLAHHERVGTLLGSAAIDFDGILLNDLQAGPASCGCGNLQCRWAIDYGVESTCEKIEGDDVALRFVQAVERLVPGTPVIPVWMGECEDQDLPTSVAPDGRSTGLCGSVHCSRGTCPEAFSAQWKALLEGHQGPIALFAVHNELERASGGAAAGSDWVPRAVAYLDEIPGQRQVPLLARERLWLVVAGGDDAAASAAAATGAAVVVAAETPLVQTFEPRLVAVP